MIPMRDLREHEDAHRVPLVNDMRNAAKCEAMEEWARERLTAQRPGWRGRLSIWIAIARV
jgi:hypothetical protein